LLFSGTGLSLVEVDTGKQLVFYEWFDPAIANVVDPIVFENKVYLSTLSSKVGCGLLDLAGNQAEIVWQNKKTYERVSLSVMVDGYLYGTDGPGGMMHTLRCTDWKTGKKMWEEEFNRKPISFMAAGGKFIILEENGTLHIAEVTPSSYKEISSGDVLDDKKKFRKFWAPPVLYNSRIYCRNYEGDLVCIDVSK